MAQIYLKNWHLAILTIFIAALLSSCSGPLMNQQNYSRIQVGMPVSEVRAIAGEPYRINHPHPSIESHEYLERFDVGAGRTHQNTYILTIQNGIVTDKQVVNDSPGMIGVNWR